MKIYIDGQYFDQNDAKISVFDHGLLYGDGVFEGIRFYNRRVFRLEEHMDRLCGLRQGDLPENSDLARATHRRPAGDASPATIWTTATCGSSSPAASAISG